MPSLKNLETVPNLLVKYFDFLSPFSKEDFKKKYFFYLPYHLPNIENLQQQKRVKRHNFVLW